MSGFEDAYGRDLTVGDYVWLDDHGEVRQVADLDSETGKVVDDFDEDWSPDYLELLEPYPSENPEWFYEPGSERWIAPVGDGTVHVCLYPDELKSLDAARAERRLHRG